jgi:hypothetical protein
MQWASDQLALCWWCSWCSSYHGIFLCALLNGSAQTGSGWLCCTCASVQSQTHGPQEYKSQPLTLLQQNVLVPV